MIEMLNIRKVFNTGKPNAFAAVDGVSLEIRAREATVLTGPSGSGKTTLLALVGCMMRPSSGRIRLDGREMTSLPERFLAEVRRSTFGFIFQQFNLIRGITALENVMLPAYPVGESYAALKRRAHAILDRLALSGKSSERVERLSGGEIQRVAIARSLINNPSYIIADEPTAHLDTALSRELLNILAALKQEGRTIILASHDPIVYESALIDRVIRLRDGKLEA